MYRRAGNEGNFRNVVPFSDDPKHFKVLNDVLRLGVKIGNDAVIQHGGDGRSAADDNCIFMVRLYGFQIVVQGWAGTDHKSRHIAGLLGAFEYPRRLLGQIKIRIVDHIQFVVDEARREH